MKRIYIFSLLVLLSLFSCEETVILDVNELDDRLIIEGQLTDVLGRNFVKITRSRDFYFQGPAPRVTNATVEVSDELGVTHVFAHNPLNDPELEGFYYPVNPFAGRIGGTYELNVNVDGQNYRAVETMLPVTEIDSLGVILDEEEMEEPEAPGRFYEVTFFALEPQDRKDQYLFKFYRNDTLIKDFPTDIYFSDDEFLGDTIDNLTIAGWYADGDRCRVEMYSLTQEAFIFYSDLFNLLNNDGGMFSPPPADPRNNLSNGALGYWQVSALDEMEIVVIPPKD